MPMSCPSSIYVCVCVCVCVCVRVCVLASTGSPLAVPLFQGTNLIGLSAILHLWPVTLPITSNTCVSVSGCAYASSVILSTSLSHHPPICLLCLLSVCPPAWSPPSRLRLLLPSTLDLSAVTSAPKSELHFASVSLPSCYLSVSSHTQILKYSLL